MGESPRKVEYGYLEDVGVFHDSWDIVGVTGIVVGVVGELGEA